MGDTPVIMTKKSIPLFLTLSKSTSIWTTVLVLNLGSDGLSFRVRGLLIRHDDGSRDSPTEQVPHVVRNP